MNEARKHLTFLCSTRALGGMELNLLRLAGWMRDRGWIITVFGLEGAPYTERATEKNLAVASVPRYRKYFDVGGAKALARGLAEQSVDVLFLSSNRDMNTAALAKYVFMPRLKLLHLQQMQLGIPKRDLIHTWEFRRLDAWIAPLEWLADQVRANTRVPDSKIRVIPLCIETERFTGAAANRDRARAELDLPADAFIAGTVGRFDEGKDQATLIRAAAQLAAAGEDVHILLVGEDTRDEQQRYGALLRDLAAQQDLEGRVHFRPFRDDVETAFAAMDVFAMTTPSETFGMVTIEAMASGVPVIAANGGGSPELLDAGDAGLLVPPRNPEALAEALLQYKQDPGLRGAMALRARNRAERFYSHTVQCRATEELIASLFR